MPRIAGVSIPNNKPIEIALTYIYGIGRTSSRKILEKAKIDFSKRTSQLTADEINLIQKVIKDDKYIIEGDRRRDIATAIKRLKDIGCWRGLRHLRHLPARGQRTRTNTRTVRGNVRRTVGSGHKPPPAPK